MEEGKEEEEQWVWAFCRNKWGEKRKNGSRFSHFLYFDIVNNLRSKFISKNNSIYVIEDNSYT